MDFLPIEIENFTKNHTQEETTLLKELNRETHLKILRPRMLSGHIQGRILSMLSHMIKPKSILEIGTYTGYSAICFAEGLQKDGKITTIDNNEELHSFTKSFFDKSEFSNQIEFILGDANEEIKKLNNSFDLVFIDADKVNYSNYYDLVIDKIVEGGFIIADNVLWSGKVTDQNSNDKDTIALIEFCKKVHNDIRVENVLFPVRDGLMILRKI